MGSNDVSAFAENRHYNAGRPGGGRRIIEACS
jgi:hypothetical protein